MGAEGMQSFPSAEEGSGSGRVRGILKNEAGS